MKDKVAQNMTDSATLIEGEILRGPWVMGDQFTVADAYLFTMVSWMKVDGVDMSQFPRLSDHYKRMLDIPAVKKVAPLHGIQ
jgi:glutathione S-transferase